MTQFNESFYTEDFDQEMLDFVKENFKITKDIDEWNLEDETLRYYSGLDYFWTGFCNNGGTKLAKQEFKDKIGMTDKEELKIYIDVKGFSEEKRKLVQDAFFKLGIKWRSDGDIEDYKYLGDLYAGYTNVPTHGYYDPYLLFNTSEPTESQVPYIHTFEQLMELAGMEQHIEKENTIQQDNTFTKDMLVSGEHVVELEDGERYLVAGDYLIGETGYDNLHTFNNTLEDNNYYDITKVYSGKSGRGSICAGGGVSSYLCSDGLTLIWQRESPEKQKQREVIQTLEEDLKRAQKALEEAKSKLEDM